MARTETIFFYILVVALVGLSIGIHFMSLNAQNDALDVIGQYEEAMRTANATLKDVTDKLVELKIEREFLLKELAEAKETTKAQKQALKEITAKITILKKQIDAQANTNYSDSTITAINSTLPK